MTTQRNKNNFQKTRHKGDEPLRAGVVTVMARAILLLAIFSVALFAALYVARPFFESVEGNFAGVIVISWILSACASIACLLAIVSLGSSERGIIAVGGERRLTATMVAAGLIGAWLVVWVFFVVGGDAGISTELWFSALIPIGVACWVGSFLLIFEGQKRAVLAVIFTGLLVSGTAILVLAYALLYLAFLIRVTL